MPTSLWHGKDMHSAECCCCTSVLNFLLLSVLFVAVEFNLWKSVGVAVTGSGQLPCRYIFHIAADLGIEFGVKACLAEAHRRKLSSITFPLLGTGMHIHTCTHAHTHNHFTALFDFVQDYLGEPAQEM